MAGAEGFEPSARGFWRPLLYQLSYTPKSHEATLQAMTIMVGLRGLEPGTDRL